MESTIRNLHSLKDCFSTQDLNSMENSDLRRVCLQERISLIESINNLNTKAIIHERVEILREKRKREIELRREFLNSYFK